MCSCVRIGSLESSSGQPGSSGFAWATPRCLRVTRGFTRARHGVVVFIRIGVGSLGRAFGAYGFFPIRVCSSQRLAGFIGVLVGSFVRA